MKYITIFCLAVCMLLPVPAQAVDTQNRYLILGPGANSCATVVSDLAQGAKLKNQAAVIIYSNWLAGSLSGYNRDTHGTYSILGKSPFTEAFEWTVDYCQHHPNQIYSAAVDAFILEYKDDRYTSMPNK